MRYLLLSVLVISLVGVLVIPVNFASAVHICEPPAIISQSPDDGLTEAKRYIECFKQNPNIIHAKHPVPQNQDGITSQDMKFMTIFAIFYSYAQLGDVDNTIYYHKMMSTVKGSNPERTGFFMMLADMQRALLCWGVLHHLKLKQLLIQRKKTLAN